MCDPPTMARFYLWHVLKKTEFLVKQLLLSLVHLTVTAMHPLHQARAGQGQVKRRRVR